MSPSRIACLACAAVIRSSQPVPPGTKIKCPKCGVYFIVPPGLGPTPDSDVTEIVPLTTAAQPLAPAVAAGPPADASELVPLSIDLSPLDDGPGKATAADGAHGAPVEVSDAAIVVETACPSCGHQGNVPEKYLGKKIKCRKCGVPFTATDRASSIRQKPAQPAPASTTATQAAEVRRRSLASKKPPANDNDDEPAPAKSRRREKVDAETEKMPMGALVIGGSLVALLVVALIFAGIVALRTPDDTGAWANQSPAMRRTPATIPHPNPPRSTPVVLRPPTAARPRFLPTFDDWLQDLEQAKKQAAQEKKDILILFDGSDWCGFSVRLAHNVLFRPEFKQAAQEKFVLVFIDFPQHPQALSKVQDPGRNDRLQKQFAIQGYPTVILADAEGRPYAVDGYQQGGPAEYLDVLAKHQAVREERDGLLAAVELAQGLPKLTAAKAALTFLNEKRLLPYHEAEVAAWNELALKLDPTNEHGCRGEFFEALWLRDLARLPISDTQRAVQLAERLETAAKAFRFKDANRGAALHLLAATILFKTGKASAALQHIVLGLAYKPTDRELKEELETARRALQGAESVPADLRLEAGTGFVVAPGGYVMTNAHVIDGKGKISVRLPGLKSPAPADIVAVDEERDIALIQIKAPEAKNLKPLTMAGNRPIERAEVVAAWGYPGGSLLGGGLKFTQGAISSIPERGTGQMLLLDVKINPGNSGGPLCDIHGNVIGMVTAKTGASRTFESYGMAIPAKDLEGFLTKHLKSYKSGVASRKPLKWDQVDRQVSPSVLMILNSGN